jgi:hypothetical protein
MFGVPSGVLWDPAGTVDEVVDGVVVAPLDIAAWPPRPAREVGLGMVEALVIAPAAEPAVRLDEAALVAGRRPSSALTLVDAAVLESLGRDVDHRRNLVVRGIDLNSLAGREFTLGPVRCRGNRLCEPCAHLDRFNGGGVLAPLVHRGGLRADVLEAGRVRVGDRVAPA